MKVIARKVRKFHWTMTPQTKPHSQDQSAVKHDLKCLSMSITCMELGFLLPMNNPECRQGPDQGSRKGQQSFIVWDIARYHLPMVEYSEVWLPVNMGWFLYYFVSKFRTLKISYVFLGQKPLQYRAKVASVWALASAISQLITSATSQAEELHISDWQLRLLIRMSSCTLPFWTILL